MHFNDSISALGLISFLVATFCYHLFDKVAKKKFKVASLLPLSHNFELCTCYIKTKQKRVEDRRLFQIAF